MTARDHDRMLPAPPEARRTWREHWGLFGATLDQRMAALVHISADPIRREGVFTVVLWVDGRRFKDITRSPVPTLPESNALHSPALRFEILEPGRRCAVSYRGEEIEADLEFVTRFDAHHRITGGPDALYPIDNVQQPLTVEGELRVAGEPARAFDAFGSRDHSWGWFPEVPFRHHEWIAVSLPDRFVQLSRTRSRETGAVHEGGFAATADRVRELEALTVSDAYWISDPDEHLPPLDRDVECEAVDADGAAHRVELLLSRGTARHHSNRRDRELDRMYEQVTMFCPVRVSDEITGTAIVEIGKLLERPGVCDEPLPGAAKSGAVP
jgi:hypothetical protein